MDKTSNPMLSEKKFYQKDYRTNISSSDAMTMNGTVTKTFFLVFLVIASAAYTWHMASAQQPRIANVTPQFTPLLSLFTFGGAIGGFILALIVSFFPKTAPLLAPIYAVCQGLFLGIISFMLDTAYKGIALQAFMLTVATLALMLFLYRMGIIRVTERFKTIVYTATLAIVFTYLISFVLGFFGVQLSFLRDTSLISILISLFIVGIAALNLAIDFDFIEKGSQSGSPKYMEWYGGFALLVTLVWLYLEILRLLAKLRGRN